MGNCLCGKLTGKDQMKCHFPKALLLKVDMAGEGKAALSPLTGANADCSTTDNKQQKGKRRK